LNAAPKSPDHERRRGVGCDCRGCLLHSNSAGEKRRETFKKKKEAVITSATYSTLRKKKQKERGEKS